ncbi:hypothetical protein Q3G72_014078 [Acer saccharum]|nr:hypothetical protein Q3G72_014078 [Acer saccharum]
MHGRMVEKQVRVVHWAPRSFFGVEDFLDDDNTRSIGRILANQAREADVYSASYTPRERDNQSCGSVTH